MNEVKYNIALTQSQIENLMEFISLDFIPSIRADDSIDNFDYIVDMAHIYSELKRISLDFGLKGNEHNAYKEYCKPETLQDPPSIVVGKYTLADISTDSYSIRDLNLKLKDIDKTECAISNVDDDYQKGTPGALSSGF